MCASRKPRLPLWIGVVAIALAADATTTGTKAPWIEQLESWTGAVRDHRPGETDAAAWLVAPWPEEALLAVREDLSFLLGAYQRASRRGQGVETIRYRDTAIRIADIPGMLDLTPAEAAEGDASRVLRGGALVYADIAMSIVPRMPIGFGCMASATVLVQDGRSVGRGCAHLHWRQARLLLDAVKPSPAGDRWTRLWYRAVAVYLLEQEDYSDAHLHLEHARPLFAADAPMAFERGCYHEAYAAPRVQSVPRANDADERSASDHLREAERAFRSALEIDPSFVEARVRRGRVLDLLGRHAEAVTELRTAVDVVHDQVFRYYREMFLGNAEEHAGNLGAARDHFDAAAGLYPEAQSPRLALSQLARRSGDRAGALEALQRVFNAGDNWLVRTDPWATYHTWQLQGARALLAELYRTVPAGGLP